MAPWYPPFIKASSPEKSEEKIAVSVENVQDSDQPVAEAAIISDEEIKSFYRERKFESLKNFYKLASDKVSSDEKSIDPEIVKLVKEAPTEFESQDQEKKFYDNFYERFRKISEKEEVQNKDKNGLGQIADLIAPAGPYLLMETPAGGLIDGAIARLEIFPDPEAVTEGEPLGKTGDDWIKSAGLGPYLLVKSGEAIYDGLVKGRELAYEEIKKGREAVHDGISYIVGADSEKAEEKGDKSILEQTIEVLDDGMGVFISPALYLVYKQGETIYNGVNGLVNGESKKPEEKDDKNFFLEVGKGWHDGWGSFVFTGLYLPVKAAEGVYSAVKHIAGRDEELENIHRRSIDSPAGTHLSPIPTLSDAQIKEISSTLETASTGMNQNLPSIGQLGVIGSANLKTIAQSVKDVGTSVSHVHTCMLLMGCPLLLIGAVLAVKKTRKVASVTAPSKVKEYRDVEKAEHV